MSRQLRQINPKLVAILDFVLDSIEFDFHVDSDEAEDLLAECLIRNVVFIEIKDMIAYLKYRTVSDFIKKNK